MTNLTINLKDGLKELRGCDIHQQVIHCTLTSDSKKHLNDKLPLRCYEKLSGNLCPFLKSFLLKITGIDQHQF